MCVPAPPQSAIGGSGLSPAPWQWQGSRIRAGLVRPECCERLRSEPPSGGCVRWFRVGRAVATAATPRQSHYGGRGVGGAEEAEAGRTAGETRGELAVASFAQPGGPGPWRRLAVSAPHAKDFSAASWPEVRAFCFACGSRGRLAFTGPTLGQGFIWRLECRVKGF